LIALEKEKISADRDLVLFDARDTWKTTTLKKGNYRLREMMEPIFENGKLVYDSPTVAEIKKYAEEEKESLGSEYKRLTNPHIMKVDLSDQLYELKQELIQANKMEK